MEHAKIILIIEPVAIVTHNRHVETGDLTNVPIDTPLRTAAMVASLMGIVERTTSQVSIPLAVTLKHVPAHMTQADALLTTEIIISTNAKAFRNNLIEATTVRGILNILAILNHAHNIMMSEINTEDQDSVNSIETCHLLGTTTIPKGRFKAMTAIRENNAIMNVIIGLLKMGWDRIHTTQEGKTDLKRERKIILATLINTNVMEMSKSCSRVTTNILRRTVQFKPKMYNHIQSKARLGNVKSLDYPMAEF